MSSVLDRSALAESPLADLHLLANELGVDGFRRLRKDDLIDAILTKQAGVAALGAGEVVAGLLRDDRVDQVELAEAAEAVDAELVGEQVEVGERGLRERGAIKYG